MELSADELNLVRQWFDAVKDLNPGYLTSEDDALMSKILAYLRHASSHREALGRMA